MDTDPAPSLRRWFWLLILFNVLFIGWSLYYLHPLTFEEMVRFEVARNTSTAESIVQNWAAAGKLDKALLAVYLDYIFIVLYPAGLGVAGLFFSRLTKHEILIRAGKFMVYLLIIAGICDVIENIALVRNLRGPVTRFNVLMTYDMAAAKFTVIILSLLFLLVCLLFWISNLVGRSQHKSIL